MAKEHIIYKATNLITQEIYIGQTSNTLHNRRVDHEYEAFKRGRKDKFHAAMREFGCRNFKWEEIARSNNFTNLCKLENKLIHAHNSIDYGYNQLCRRDITNKLNKPKRIKRNDK